MVLVKRIALALFWCVLVGLAPASYAQTAASSTAFDQLMVRVTGGGKQSVGFSRDGTPLISQGVPSAVPDGGAGIKVTSSGSVVNPSGNRVPVGVVGRVANSGLAGALGRGAARLAYPIAIGTTIYEVGRELGFLFSRDSTGAAVVVKEDVTNGCWTEPCFIYQVAGLTGKYTKLGACQVYETNHNSVNTASPYVASNARVEFHEPFGTDGCFVDFYRKSDGGLNSTFIAQFSATPTALSSGSAPSLPSSMQEFIDAVAAKSGWPASSKVAVAAVEAAESLGEKLPVFPPTVTGPATSPGPVTTKTEPNADGSTKTSTTTTTHNHTYFGDTVTTTTTNVTNITNNTTLGNNTTSTEVIQAPPAAEPKDTCGLPGTPACLIDEKGTPEAPKVDATKSVTDALKPLQDMAADPVTALPAFPTLNWSFQLPSGCVALAIPAFAPYLQSVDMCQFMPIFHDIMSMVWIIGGLFGAIGMFWRSTLSAV